MTTSSGQPSGREPTWEEIEAEHDGHGGGAAGGGRAAGRRRRRRRNLIEWVVAIAGALLVAWLIQTFLVQAFVIPSASMEPTLADRDRVLVNKQSYRSGIPDRGDVIVFSRPPDIELDGVDDLIKRVMATEGETIQARDGVVVIDGEELAEPYLPMGQTTEDFGPVEVPEGHVFVMGDNRGPAMSFDSRFFGPIDQDLIVGRAFALVWPLSRLATL
ncbi:MAG: signal peptidase I [Acidimicrobiales bacterium]